MSWGGSNQQTMNKNIHDYVTNLLHLNYVKEFMLYTLMNELRTKTKKERIESEFATEEEKAAKSEEEDLNAFVKKYTGGFYEQNKFKIDMVSLGTVPAGKMLYGKLENFFTNAGIKIKNHLDEQKIVKNIDENKELKKHIDRAAQLKEPFELTKLILTTTNNHKTHHKHNPISIDIAPLTST